MDTDPNLWPINAGPYSIQGHNRALPRRTTRPRRLLQDPDLRCHQRSRRSSELRRGGQHSADRRCNLALCEKAGQNSVQRLIDVSPTHSHFDFSAQRQERKKENGKGWGHLRTVERQCCSHLYIGTTIYHMGHIFCLQMSPMFF